MRFFIVSSLALSLTVVVAARSVGPAALRARDAVGLREKALYARGAGLLAREEEEGEAAVFVVANYMSDGDEEQELYARDAGLAARDEEEGEAGVFMVAGFVGDSDEDEEQELYARYAGLAARDEEEGEAGVFVVAGYMSDGGEEGDMFLGDEDEHED